MSLTVAWTKVKTVTQVFHAPGSAGHITLSNGTIVCGIVNTQGSVRHMDFYASSDEGLTWTNRSQLPCEPDNFSSRLLHWPTNIVCYASTDQNQKDLFVWRSTDAAASWTKVYTLPAPGGSTREPYAFGATTFDRTGGAFTGELARPSSGQALTQLIYTNNKGVSWTDFGKVTPSGTSNLLWGICPRPGGNFLAGASPNTTYTANPITSWSAAGSTPIPGGSAIGNIYDVTFLTDTDAVCAGFGQGGTDEHWPYVFYSSDAGATWTHVTAANIANWPTANPPHPGVRSVKRLTKNAVAIGTFVSNGNTPKPVIISTDKGHTYTNEGTGWSFNTNDSIVSQGSMVTTRSGKLLCCLDITRSSAVRTEIWRGAVTC